MNELEKEQDVICVFVEIVAFLQFHSVTDRKQIVCFLHQ